VEADRIGRDLPSKWRGAVMVCAKCSKRAGGGFGPKGKTRLAKALRKMFGLKKGRKSPVGIVEVPCLGVCPRGRVMLIDTVHSDRWRIVPIGADVAALGRELGLDQPARRASISR
jgi:predicted metal-binding protein